MALADADYTRTEIAAKLLGSAEVTMSCGGFL
jgi:hypothetical protein